MSYTNALASFDLAAKELTSKFMHNRLMNVFQKLLGLGNIDIG